MSITLREKQTSYWSVQAITAVLITLVSGFGIAVLLWKPVVLPDYDVTRPAGEVEFYSRDEGTWLPLRAGETVGAHRKIRTGRGGRVDLTIPGQAYLRLQENSFLEIRAPQLFERGTDFRLHLERGTLLAATDKKYEGNYYEVTTPGLTARAGKGGLFRISLPVGPPPAVPPSVTVLRGTVKVRPNSAGIHRWITVKNLEKTVVDRQGRPGEPYQMSRQDWREVKEAYELGMKESGFERRQMDLSKSAGNLFEHVLDHGTFYTPELGYALREFSLDGNSGEAHLEIEYDVFPTGAFVGMYMKTRDFNLADFGGLEFQVRTVSGEDAPSSFRIEIKSKFGIARTFKASYFAAEWTTVRFPWKARKDTPIAEVTLVFSWDRVGDHKKGFLEFRNFTLIPRAASAQTNPPPSGA